MNKIDELSAAWERGDDDGWVDLVRGSWPRIERVLRAAEDVRRAIRIGAYGEPEVEVELCEALDALNNEKGDE